MRWWRLWRGCWTWWRSCSVVAPLVANGAPLGGGAVGLALLGAVGLASLGAIGLALLGAVRLASLGAVAFRCAGFVRAHSAGHPWPAGDTLTQARSVPLKHTGTAGRLVAGPQGYFWPPAGAISHPLPAPLRSGGSVSVLAGKRAQLPRSKRGPALREVEHDSHARFPKPPACSRVWEVQHAFEGLRTRECALPLARRSGAPLRPDLPSPKRGRGAPAKPTTGARPHDSHSCAPRHPTTFRTAPRHPTAPRDPPRHHPRQRHPVRRVGQQRPIPLDLPDQPGRDQCRGE